MWSRYLKQNGKFQITRVTISIVIMMMMTIIMMTMMMTTVNKIMMTMIMMMMMMLTLSFHKMIVAGCPYGKLCLFQRWLSCRSPEHCNQGHHHNHDPCHHYIHCLFNVIVTVVIMIVVLIVLITMILIIMIMSTLIVLITHIIMIMVSTWNPLVDSASAFVLSLSGLCPPSTHCGRPLVVMIVIFGSSNP